MPNLFDDVVLTKDNFTEVMSNMRKQESVFLNSECMVVEYHDVLKMPWYILLTVINQNNALRELANINLIEDLSTTELFEWYYHRKNRNFLLDIAKPGSIGIVDYDKLLSLLSKNEIFYQADTELNLVDVVKTVLSQKLIKKLIVVSDDTESDEYIKKDIEYLFSNHPKVSYMSGEFEMILKSGEIPIDTTYILSDYTKIIALDNADMLNYSSLVLPMEFDYNFHIERDEHGNPIKRTPVINFDYFKEKAVFKYAFYNVSFT